jgi:hypothetical protein
LQNDAGSWALLVTTGGLKVSPRFPVRRRVVKTALSLGESFSISLVESMGTSTREMEEPSLRNGVVFLTLSWAGTRGKTSRAVFICMYGISRCKTLMPKGKVEDDAIWFARELL